jgi:3-oxoacyl-[acyl-carrier protein] reductase
MIAIDLAGKTVLITGATQGIGQMIARTLHCAGANVVINYLDDSGGQNRAMADTMIDALGVRCAALGADVRDQDAVSQMVGRAVDQFEQIDIIINNAGIIRDRTLKKMSPGDWSAVIDTNLTGVFNVCKAVEPVLADDGRIINLASIAGVMGFYGQSNYAAAKAGVIGLTKVLSKELAKRRITVNAIAPGMIKTPMAKTVPDEVQAEMIKAIPLGSFGEPSDVAYTAAFLCSDLARYITGQTIHVNGGWYV